MLEVKSLWISDVHIYLKGAKSKELFNFLSKIKFHELYIIGDFFDLWQINIGDSGDGINKEATDDAVRVMRAIMSKSITGAKITYIPGNHDSFLRNFNGQEFLGCQFKNQCDYTSLDGRKFLVTHGDLYDASVRCRWFAMIASWAYNWINGLADKWRSVRGKSRFSLSEYIKKANNVISEAAKIEETIAKDVAKKGYNGVICGHTHIPENKMIDDVCYMNCGDWVVSMTGLVETLEGEFSLITKDQEFILKEADSAV